MRKLCSNIATDQPATSRERGNGGQLRAAAQRGWHNPEDAEDPMSSARPIRDAHLKADFALIILPIIILLSSTKQMILTVALWPFSNGENHLTQNNEKTLWSNTRERMQIKEKRTS